MNKFLFLGLNYKHVENRHIDTISNVYKLTDYIKTSYNLSIDEETIITDNKDKYRTSYQGILLELHKLALETWNKQIDNIFIYFTGDSINIVEYICSYNIDYKIKQGIVPSDYTAKGIISKEELKGIFEQFNPRTRIIFIADCCYTIENILGLKYTWSANTDMFCIERGRENEIPSRKIITISYALQTSKSEEDNYFNLLSINEKINSIADYITKLDNKNDTIFSSLKDIHNILQVKRINMKPTLSASYNILNENTNLFNYLDNASCIRSSFEDYKKKSYTVVNSTENLADLSINESNGFRPILSKINDMEKKLNDQLERYNVPDIDIPSAPHNPSSFKQTNISYDYTSFNRPLAYTPSNLSQSFSYQQPYSNLKNRNANVHNIYTNNQDISRSFSYVKYECYC